MAAQANKCDVKIQAEFINIFKLFSVFIYISLDSLKASDSDGDDVVKAKGRGKGLKSRAREVAPPRGHFPVRLCDSWRKLTQISAYQRVTKKKRGEG